MNSNKDLVKFSDVLNYMEENQPCDVTELHNYFNENYNSKNISDILRSLLEEGKIIFNRDMRLQKNIIVSKMNI